MNVLPVSITNYKSNLQEFRAAPVFTAKLKPMSAKQCSELKVFCHHIYEYKKGLRNLILTTEKISNKEEIYIQDSIINNDRNRVFLIYETIKDYQKYNFINREILLELYQREEKEVFSEWLTKITNIRIINMNQIEENMKCIILYKKETDNLLKNYNAKEYEIYKIMHKKGE